MTINKEKLLKELKDFEDSFLEKMKDVIESNEEVYNGVIPLDVYKLHQKGITGKGIKIGVLDNGFNDCNGKIKVKSIVDVNQKNITSTGYGHANMVCEKIVGEGIGLAPDCEVYLFDYGSQNQTTEDGLIKLLKDITIGLKYLISKDVDIISMSLGIAIVTATNKSLSYIESFYNVIKEAYDKNIILVASSGNSYDQECTITTEIPARFSECISVGATNENMNRVKYSSTGKVDIMIQGDNLYHYRQDGILEIKGEGGTSSATPQIAAIIALLKQQNMNLNQSDILNIFKKYSTDLEVVGFDNKTGYGYVRAIEIPSDYKLVELSQDKEKTNSTFSYIRQYISEKDKEENTNVIDPIYLLRDKLNVKQLHDAGIKGKGVKIGLIGAGCENLADYNIAKYLDMTPENINWVEGFGNQLGNISTSIIASKTLGIAPEAEIYILRNFKTNGWVMAENTNKAFEWCINNNMDIVIAWQYTPLNLIKKLADKGTIVIAPSIENLITSGAYAGMASEDINTISVSYVYTNNQYEKDSKYASFASDNVDCTAYGCDFDFYGRNGVEFLSKDTIKASLYRTLFACYEVMGVLALMKQQDKSLNVTKVREYLKNNCRPISGDTKKQVGYGLIQGKIL